MNDIFVKASIDDERAGVDFSNARTFADVASIVLEHSPERELDICRAEVGNCNVQLAEAERLAMWFPEDHAHQAAIKKWQRWYWQACLRLSEVIADINAGQIPLTEMQFDTVCQMCEELGIEIPDVEPDLGPEVVEREVICWRTEGF